VSTAATENNVKEYRPPLTKTKKYSRYVPRGEIKIIDFFTPFMKPNGTNTFYKRTLRKLICPQNVCNYNEQFKNCQGHFLSRAEKCDTRQVSN
jgi:hypothetical protein